MNQVEPRTGLDAIDGADWRVRKIGGTAAGRLRQNADIAEQGNQVLVISAIRGGKEFDEFRHPDVHDFDNDGNEKKGFNTTSHLIEIGHILSDPEADREEAMAKAIDITNRIRRVTKTIAGREVGSDDKIKNKAIAYAQLHGMIDYHVDNVFRAIRDAEPSDFVRIGKDWLVRKGDSYFSITGMAEDMAAEVHNTYFRNRGLAPGLLENGDLADAVFELGPEAAQEQRKETLDAISSHTRDQLDELIGEGKNTIVSGGYRPGVGWERGYTETTALITSVVMKEMGNRVVCVIEGDFAIHSGDPNKLKRTQVILNLTYDAAMELFDFNAGANSGAVQAPSLEIGARNDIDIVVCDPRSDDLANNSTLISNDPAAPNGIEITESKTIPTMLLISSEEMLGAGFFYTVTEWFAFRGVSIDHIPTSAKTMTITFTNQVLDTDYVTDFTGMLADFETHMHSEYESINSITRHDEQTLIYCIGNNMTGIGAHARASIALAISGTPLNISSVSLADTTMVFGVDTINAPRAMQLIHDMGIVDRDMGLLEVHQKYAPTPV